MNGCTGIAGSHALRCGVGQTKGRLRNTVWIGVALLGLLGLTACGDKAPDEPTQQDLVAMVGDVAITRHELDLAWQRVAAPDTAPELAAEQRKAILADWVRMEALAQRAQKDGLDEGAHFQAEAAAAQRRALALQVEREAQAKAPSVTPRQVRRVIEGYPLAFRERQFLTIEELLFPAPAEPLVSGLVEAGQRGDSFDSLQRLLREANVVPHRRVYSAGTDQLRPDLITALLAAKPGEAVVGRHGAQQMQIMVLRVATAAPLVDEAATLAATSVLNAQLRQRVVQQRVAQVVSASPITYFGEFVAPEAPATPASQPTSATALALAPDFGDAEGLKAGLPQGLAQPVGWKRWRVPGLAGLLTVASAVALLLWVMVVRHWVGSLWLPVIWPWRRARQRPSLAVLLAQHVLKQSAQRFELKAWLGSWLLLAPALLGAATFWQQVQTSLVWLDAWIVAGCVGTGLLLGLPAAYIFAQSRWRTATRQRLWLPVLLASAALVLVTRVALLVFA